jgi:hypothetical protein
VQLSAYSDYAIRVLMQTEMPTLPATPNAMIPLDPNALCEGCGKFGAYHFGEVTFCLECYEGSSSCCPEFGEGRRPAEGHPSPAPLP